MEGRCYYPQYDDDYLQEDAIEEVDSDDVDAHGLQCFEGVPAYGEAILLLPETGVKEGDCSVCLENFEAGNKS